MVEEYRALQPEFVLTHSFQDPYNPDHETANRMTLRNPRLCAGAGLSGRGQGSGCAAGLSL